MLDRLVRDTELAKVMTHHFGLDLNRVELFAGVDADYASDHFRNNDHIAKVCLDGVRLLIWLRLLLGLAQLLDEAHRFALQATIESATCARVNDIAELFAGEIEQPGGKSIMH